MAELLPEGVVLTTEIARAWKADTRTIESGLRRQGVPIISISPNKRGVLRQHYQLLLENRSHEISRQKVSA